MYTGMVKDDAINADLLAIAYKYEVEELQDLCEATLCNHMSLENVLDVWTNANRLGAERLMNASESFLMKHWHEVKATEAFSAMMKENPASLASITIKIVDNGLNTNFRQESYLY